ncbi:superoxide dismutase [Cu-Zn] isoform X1 [Athalia rosae]|uniref:superoxide dismutase [Cu-Zn] isoform X1 n=1 Tax=Athalia rosae TaxID=37344 RepID=UPI002033681B|nr:superoxide dismutase [Cu-Zn] isoform X1 [Athalia rosae]XP_012251679.2 superoxide dismutase [Cu-Zn] isoform X1 [Athalia rosae]XP_012251680.2 superoxide dismutase [Cu-Zn] isoform X1 [Athalia rosae]XP_048508626.1 superoxide dismutase [Cu-Zn] isoform X1 [Athalia rosae]
MAFKEIVAFLALGVVATVSCQDCVATVQLNPHNADKYNVTGSIRFTQSYEGGPVLVSGNVYGLTPGDHGFHIHATGDLSDGCTSALGHFNPHNHSHGAPEDDQRHVGDLGNIEASSQGIASVNFSDHIISLSGVNGIVGRSVVVHSAVDDLGRGGHKLSSTTGNAGDRVACGVIGILSPEARCLSNSGNSLFWSTSTLLTSLGISAIFNVKLYI